jgi:hypothetical protein
MTTRHQRPAEMAKSLAMQGRRRGQVYITLSFVPRHNCPDTNALICTGSQYHPLQMCFSFCAITKSTLVPRPNQAQYKCNIHFVSLPFPFKFL